MGRSTRTQRRRRRNRDKERGFVNSPSPSTFSQIAVPGNYPFGGINSGELIRRAEVSFAELQLMVDMDGHARAIWNAYKRAIVRSSRHAEVIPLKRNGQNGEKEAEFIHDMIKLPRSLGGMVTSFPKTVAQQMMSTLFGFQAFEKVRDKPGTVIDDGLIHLNRLMPLSHRATTFKVDESGRFEGIHFRAQWRNQTIDRDILPRDLAYISIDEEENPYYGKSMFLPAYYHFDKKHKLYYILHLALSVGALPPRIARKRMNIDDADSQRFLDAISNLGANAAMIMPDGLEMKKDEQLQGASGGLPYIEAIEHHNLEMSQSIGMQFIDVGTGGGGGAGFSMSKNHMDSSKIGIEEIQSYIGDMWQEHVLPEFIHWNFGSENIPTIKLAPITNDQREAMQEVFEKVIGVRETPLSPEFIAELEKSMSEELGFEDMDGATIDAHQAQRQAQQELEAAMEQANRDLSRQVSNMTTEEILKDPAVMNYISGWWESTSRRMSDKLVTAGGENA